VRRASRCDVATAAAILASDEASFVNGTTFFPDGGITAGLYSATAAQLVAQPVAD